MKLSTDELKLITMFETTTKAHVKDCVIGKKEVIFVVDEGNMGLAIGKNGEAVAKVKTKIGKNVSVIEYNEDPKIFVKRLFSPAQLETITVDGEKVTLKTKEMKRITGRSGKRLERAKNLLERHYNIKEIIIQEN